MIVTYSCWVFVVKLGSRDLLESTRVPFGGMGHLLTYCELQAPNVSLQYGITCKKWRISSINCIIKRDKSDTEEEETTSGQTWTHTHPVCDE